VVEEVITEAAAVTAIEDGAEAEAGDTVTNLTTTIDPAIMVVGGEDVREIDLVPDLLPSKIRKQ
jgi:hypothetical protein